MNQLKIKDQSAQQASWIRQEKKGKMRSFHESGLNATYIVFEKKTKRGKWVRAGKIRIK